MNYIITYFIRGYKFQGVFNDEEYAELETRQDQGELCIYEVMAEESAVNYWEVSLL